MATSGLTSFNPATSDLILNAFSRIQLSGSKLTSEHLMRAETEANLALVKLSNKQPNLWTSALRSDTLSAGTPTYTLSSDVVDIIIVYLTTTEGGVSTDRVLGPISTVEYASLPNKSQSGVPTSFWFDRQAVPQITFWPVPDNTMTYVAKSRYLRQIQNASARNGLNMDLPYRWLDAFSCELSWRLAMHFKPETAQILKALSDEAWNDAAGEDTESVNMMVTPGLSSYFR